jgi:hypothetical protein
MGRKDIKSKYLRHYAFPAPISKSGKKISIVIPAYAEHILLPETLDSLNQCSNAEQVRVIVVVNHGPAASDSVIDSNERAWNFLQSSAGQLRYDLVAIDCRNKGAFARSKKIGVGLARKVGMDSALESFSGAVGQGLLVCLDADCLVSKNYVLELLRWQQDCPAQGTVNIPFEHRLPKPGPQRQAIVTYELFLRYYVGGLKAFANPYAHHSMGSAYGTRMQTYCAVRGMARLKAAEDFYFLDKVRKVAPIGQLLKAKVYPSARTSDRVLFGTGKTMMKAQRGDLLKYFYDPKSFPLMARIRTLLSRGGHEDEVKALADESSLALFDYLKSRRWTKVRSRLFKFVGGTSVATGRFDDWFDGLESLKLAHFIRDELYPPQLALEAMPALAQLLGEKAPEGDLEAWLQWAREVIP